MNVHISHVTLPPQTCQSETFTSIFCCLSLSRRNLTFQMLKFWMLTFPILLSHQAFLLSKMKHQFENTKCVVFNYEKRANFKYENVSFSNTKKCPFQMRKSGIFRKEVCVIFKYKKCVIFIQLTYGWHTSIYEWHAYDIRVHTSDARMKFEHIRVTHEWHMNKSTYEWHTDGSDIDRCE